MNEILNCVAENLDNILLCGAVVLSNVLGRPKTAERLKAIQEKRTKKLVKKSAKQVAALEKTTTEIEKISNINSEVK